MKMVSQLTRQAMSRHRLLSAAAYPDISAPVPSKPTAPAEPPPSIRPLYTADAPSPMPPTPPAPPAPVLPERRRTIYSELMKKHDLFTERHLTSQ